ncbi:MAG: hypothetical protein IKD72_02775, partial [Clostridia bacterium]|nr:hypothetical protein [Clostridia bacterium]
MKKVLAILLSVLTLCSLPLSAFAEGTDDGRADSKAFAFIQDLTETDKWSLDLRIENSEEPVSVTLYKNGGAYAVDGRFMGILITRVVITEEETWIASPLVLPFICSTVDPEDYGLSVKVE